MTEDRKHAILFATTLLCARKIIELIDTDASMRMGKQHWLNVFEEEAIDQVFGSWGRLMSGGLSGDVPSRTQQSG